MHAHTLAGITGREVSDEDEDGDEDNETGDGAESDRESSASEEP